MVIYIYISILSSILPSQWKIFITHLKNWIIEGILRILKRDMLGHNYTLRKKLYIIPKYTNEDQPVHEIETGNW